MSICGLILPFLGLWGWCLLVFAVFSLAFYLGITLCVMHARKKYIADLEVLDALFMIGDMLKANMTKAITVMSTTQAIKFSLAFALGCAIAGPIGYYLRGNQEKTARYTYTEVTITARHDSQHFDVQPERMSAWGLVPCEPEDWQKNQKMKRLTFSVRNLADGRRCHDVERGGDYEFYTKDGKRIIYNQEIVSNVGYQTP